MTDQPRDLAAEVESISRIHDEGRYEQYGEHPAESIGTLLDYIAALSRELEEHREALTWALQRGAFHPGHGDIYVPSHGERMRKVESPPHLAPILAEAMRSKV